MQRGFPTEEENARQELKNALENPVYPMNESRRAELFTIGTHLYGFVNLHKGTLAAALFFYYNGGHEYINGIMTREVLDEKNERVVIKTDLLLDTVIIPKILETSKITPAEKKILDIRSRDQIRAQRHKVDIVRYMRAIESYESRFNQSKITTTASVDVTSIKL